MTHDQTQTSGGYQCGRSRDYWNNRQAWYCARAWTRTDAQREAVWDVCCEVAGEDGRSVVTPDDVRAVMAAHNA